MLKEIRHTSKTSSLILLTYKHCNVKNFLKKYRTNNKFKQTKINKYDEGSI